VTSLAGGKLLPLRLRERDRNFHVAPVTFLLACIEKLALELRWHVAC